MEAVHQGGTKKAVGARLKDIVLFADLNVIVAVMQQTVVEF